MSFFSKVCTDESGQAFVEMCVGLVAMMLVLVGLIFIASLSSESIRTLISSRENADVGNGSISPNYINDWNAGADGINFTGDDQFKVGDAVDFRRFSSELSNSTISLFDNDRFSSSPLVVGAVQSNIFLDASHLKGAKGKQLNTTKELFDSIQLTNALRTLFGVDNIDLTDFRGNQVFMPNIDETAKQP